jgi:hypothetical protein
MRLKGWLPFPNTYRTTCIALEPEFLAVLQEMGEGRLHAFA